MFFAPCILIQLCSTNQEMHTFQINVLIRFLMSSTCFEPHGCFITKTVCKRSFWPVCLLCIGLNSLAGGRLCIDALQPARLIT
jgi:hypothetical protein